MARPTREDAHLMLELASWRTASGVAEATNWTRSDEFVSDFPTFEERFPEGSEGRLRVNRVLGYHETLATLWKNRLISEELVFDWAWVTGIWDRLADIAVGMRKKAGVDAMWENFEAMAERQRTLMVRPARRTTQKRVPARKQVPAKRASRSRSTAARKRSRS